MWRSIFFLMVGFVPFGSGTLAVVGYVLNIPQLYSFGGVPMALFTAWSFTTIGVGFIYLGLSEMVRDIKAKEHGD